MCAAVPLAHDLPSTRQSTGSRKRAIVAVARRVLCVMFSMLRSGKGYRVAA
jgi:hypothetical protein